MAEISIGEAATEGFRVIGRNPLAVGAWGLVQALAIAAPILLLAPLYAAMFGELARAGASGGAPNPMAWQAQAMQAQGVNLLVQVVVLFVNAVLTCAVFRSVLRPEKPGLAWLSLGMPELFYALFLFGVGIVAAIGIVVLAIPIGIVIGVMAATHAPPIIIGAVAVVLFLALAIVALWLAVRFSMIGPILVDTGQLQIGQAWNMTKGHAGALFLVGLMLVLMILLIEAVLVLAIVMLGVGVLGAAAGGVDHIRELASRSPTELLKAALPAVVVYVLVMIPMAGCLQAIMNGPWARAYLQLRGPDVPGTFA